MASQDLEQPWRRRSVLGAGGVGSDESENPSGTGSITHSKPSVLHYNERSTEAVWDVEHRSLEVR
jgi:hypothetical protein